MPTKLQSHQVVHEAVLKVLGKATRAELLAIVNGIDTELDVPLRLRAEATPSALLVIEASQLTTSDGGKRVASVVDDTVGNYVQTTLNLQTGSISGGTITRDGQTFSLPSTTVGQFRLMAMVYKAASNTIDVSFSSASATEGALENPGLVFSRLDGLPIGYVVLVATGATAFKTAGSATNVIENTKIYRFGAGSGAGGGADRTYRISSFSATGCTLKGGYAYLDDGRVVSSGAGTTSSTTGIDITVSLNTILTASGLAALGTINSAASKLLALCLDITTLSSVTTLTDNKRQVYTFAEANLKLFDQADLGLIDPRRYVLLDQILIPQTVTSWATATGIVKPSRVHDTLATYFPYLERYTSPQQTSAVASTTLTHGLSAEPQIVQVFYYDGAKKFDVTKDSLLDKTATQVKISTLGMTFGSGEYVEVQAFYIPTFPNVGSASRQFRSGWYSDTSVTTVAHGLSDMDDLVGYAVQEWNVTTGRRRQIDPSALIVDFDDANVYLDWSGLTPTSNLRYRVVAGGSPMPWSMPVDEVYDQTFTAEPSWPIAHGLSAVPTQIEALQEISANVWQPILLTGHVAASASQLTGTLAAFSPGASPARIRIIARVQRT